MNGESLHQLKIITPRLELYVPTNNEIKQLAYLLADGIQQPNTPHFMDEGMYQTFDEIMKWLPEFIANATSSWNKNDWKLPFGIFYNHKPIGLLTMYSKDFPITKGFGASYWIGLSYQGQGFATEALHGLLYFAFEKLSAQEAYIGAWSDNTPSLRVMEKLGFVFNGEYWMNRQGVAVKDKRMRLPQEKWENKESIIIEGLDTSLLLFK